MCTLFYRSCLHYFTGHVYTILPVMSTLFYRSCAFGLKHTHIYTLHANNRGITYRKTLTPNKCLIFYNCNVNYNKLSQVSGLRLVDSIKFKHSFVLHLYKIVYAGAPDELSLYLSSNIYTSCKHRKEILH